VTATPSWPARHDQVRGRPGERPAARGHGPQPAARRDHHVRPDGTVTCRPGRGRPSPGLSGHGQRSPPRQPSARSSPCPRPARGIDPAEPVHTSGGPAAGQRHWPTRARLALPEVTALEPGITGRQAGSHGCLPGRRRLPAGGRTAVRPRPACVFKRCLISGDRTGLCSRGNLNLITETGAVSRSVHCAAEIRSGRRRC